MRNRYALATVLTLNRHAKTITRHPLTDNDKTKILCSMEWTTDRGFETWEDCKAQTDKFPKAVYKSFKTRQLAEQAFKDEWWDYIGKHILKANSQTSNSN